MIGTTRRVLQLSMRLSESVLCTVIIEPWSAVCFCLYPDGAPSIKLAAPELQGTATHDSSSSMLLLPTHSPPHTPCAQALADKLLTHRLRSSIQLDPREGYPKFDSSQVQAEGLRRTARWWGPRQRPYVSRLTFYPATVFRSLPPSPISQVSGLYQLPLHGHSVVHVELIATASLCREQA